MDEKIEKAIEPVVKMYSDLETELLIKIAENFKVNEKFINSDYFRVQKLNEMGAFNKEVIDFIAEYTKSSPEVIKRALERVYNETIDYDNLMNQFNNGNIKIDPSNILKSPALINIMQDSYNEVENTFIELSKKIEEATRRAYLNVVEKGYLATYTGTKSYSEAIRDNLDELAKRGITTLTYTTKKDDGSTSIRNYSIEGTVRREILTNTRALNGKINIELINELEFPYVKFSEHLECRPTHFDWQGTIVKTKDWERIADYGSVTGIYGINCRHYIEPYMGDNSGSDEKRLTKEECDKAYKESQHQRYLERGVRYWKRRKNMAKASNDTEIFNKANAKVKEWNKKLDDYTTETNRRRKYINEYVSKIKVNKTDESQTKLYEDITDNVLKNAIPNDNDIEKIFEYKQYNLSNSKFDNKDIGDLEIAAGKRIQNQLGGKVKLIPRIQKDGVSTPDMQYENYQLFDGVKYFDIKSPRASLNDKSHNNKIAHQLSEVKKQTNNAIISLLREDCDITNEEAFNQVIKCLNNKNYNWLENVILIGTDNYIKIFRKK